MKARIDNVMPATDTTERCMGVILDDNNTQIGEIIFTGPKGTYTAGLTYTLTLA